MAKSSGLLRHADPAFPDQVFTLPTMMVMSHRVTHIPQGDDDDGPDGKAVFVKQAIKRMRAADRLKYPGLYDPED